MLLLGPHLGYEPCTCLQLGQQISWIIHVLLTYGADLQWGRWNDLGSDQASENDWQRSKDQTNDTSRVPRPNRPNCLCRVRGTRAGLAFKVKTYFLNRTDVFDYLVLPICSTLSRLRWEWKYRYFEYWLVSGISTPRKGDSNTHAKRKVRHWDCGCKLVSVFSIT